MSKNAVTIKVFNLSGGVWCCLVVCLLLLMLFRVSVLIQAFERFWFFAVKTFAFSFMLQRLLSCCIQSIEFVYGNLYAHRKVFEHSKKSVQLWIRYKSDDHFQVLHHSVCFSRLDRSRGLPVDFDQNFLKLVGEFLIFLWKILH